MNNFHRIAELIDANDQRVKIVPLENITGIQSTRLGIKITIGAPGELMGPLARGELAGGLLLVDPEVLKSIPAEPTPEIVRKAIEDLRASTGPGGVRREDFLLLCDYVEAALNTIAQLRSNT